MTSDELMDNIRKAVAYVESLTPEQRRAGHRSGLLDRRCDAETGKWQIPAR
jgi:hypothetical protein